MFSRVQCAVLAADRVGLLDRCVACSQILLQKLVRVYHNGAVVDAPRRLLLLLQDLLLWNKQRAKVESGSKTEKSKDQSKSVSAEEMRQSALEAKLTANLAHEGEITEGGSTSGIEVVEDLVKLDLDWLMSQLR